MGLAPHVLDAIKNEGYTTPSPIQAQTVPHLMEGRDLIGQAETGSGKTAAFAWPILSQLDLSQHAPQVIVLAPTRELAMQVTAAFKKYASALPGFRATTIYGGQSYETQFRALDRGCHVVVGTPGRVMDHLNRGTLDLRQLKMFVLDEADEMLRMGFIDDIEFILSKTPGDQQSLFFSATMPQQIERIAGRYLTDPVQIRIESKTATAETIKQSCVFVSAREKLARLVRLLETEETDGVLVFVKTRQTTIVVAEHLIQKGVIASALNGDIAQQQRERTVSQLKSGRINIVVATDVAARGLDVSRISHVINYDFPHDTEAYVHRIGRTGRAGRDGNAILFVEPKEKGKLSRLQRATNQRIDTFKEKSLQEINDIRIGKFTDRIAEQFENEKLEFFQNLITKYQQESELPLEQIAASLALMAQGDQPLVLEALETKSNWKKDREKRGGGKGDHGPMQSFRVEIGRRDNVGPGNLVGAITNEADLTNADIGRIKIFDNFSTIDLPADLPESIITHLAGVHVSGRPMEISKSDGRESGGGGGGGRRFGGGGGRGRDGGGRGGRDFGGRGRRDDRGGRSDRGGFARGGRDENRGRSDRGGYKGRDDRGGSESGGEKRPYEKKTYEKKPYEKKSYGDKSYAKKPYGSKSYSDRGGSAKTEGGGRPSGDKREYTTSKAGPGKTKAAARAKSKRRPGAKASSPVKKYVKIRAKKK